MGLSIAYNSIMPMPTMARLDNPGVLMAFCTVDLAPRWPDIPFRFRMAHRTLKPMTGTTIRELSGSLGRFVDRYCLLGT